MTFICHSFFTIGPLSLCVFEKRICVINVFGHQCCVYKNAAEMWRGVKQTWGFYHAFYEAEAQQEFVLKGNRDIFQ